MTAPTFRRYLGPAFTKALYDLVEAPTGQWWRDVLVHPNLKLAVRADAIDVYHHGSAIFRIASKGGHIVPRTHFKYLIRRRQGHAVLAEDGKTFVYGPGETSWTTYEQGRTLEEMIAASERFAVLEKAELHPLVMHPSVIDVEIAFRSPTDDAAGDGAPDAEPDDLLDESAAPGKAPGSGFRQDRLDAATLEDRNGALWIAFHEAKHFTNPELRASPDRAPPVAEQIARYRRSIEAFASQIQSSYREVCQALRELHAMRIKADPEGTAQATGLPPLVQRAADGEPLRVDGEPRLIVFGFDDDQKRGPTWTHHRQRLEEAKLTVYAVGKPNMKGAAAAFAHRGR